MKRQTSLKSYFSSETTSPNPSTSELKDTDACESESEKPESDSESDTASNDGTAYDSASESASDHDVDDEPQASGLCPGTLEEGNFLVNSIIIVFIFYYIN